MNKSSPATAPRAGSLGTGDAVVAGFWGLAEATLFFIVPDVWLTRVALRDGLGAAWRATGWALLGALFGGLILYEIAQHGGTEGLNNLFNLIPGIGPPLITQAGVELEQHGLIALFTGALTGIPYKLYATHAGTAGLPLGTFILVSALARMTRFGLSVSAAAFACRLGLARCSVTNRLRIHAVFWVVFYGFYLGFHRG